MCRAILSLAEKRTLDTVVAQEAAKRERRRLRKIFKDLSRRCVLQEAGIDLPEFLKFVELPGLLGQQFFKAMNTAKAEFIGSTEFVNGVTVMYKGGQEEVIKFLFSLLEFNETGRVTLDSTRMLLRYLPTDCRKCEQGLIGLAIMDESLTSIFGEHAVLSVDDFLTAAQSHLDFIDLLYTAVLNSFPEVVDDVMGRERKCRCEKRAHRGSAVIMSIPEIMIRPLRFQGHRYCFELQHKALYYYKSVERNRIKGIIVLNGLFVSPMETTKFELKNLRYTYCFEASSIEERDGWVAMIQEAVHYEWFDDEYETRESLGSGAYGQVLKAVERKTGRVAAVKIISKQGMDTKAELRIRREIDILKLVKHENLLRLVKVYETAERLYLVTELIEGGPLFGWLERQNFQIPEWAARDLVRDICSGLNYLHSYGIVHRDIKLENVMLEFKGPSMKAKLIDYGLSCFLGPGEMTQEPVGTLKYVAPEIISRMQYREKIDCWSLGVIVFILLQGTVPFFGKNDQEVALKILRKKMRFDTEKWAGVSHQARVVVEGLLNRKPDRRMTIPDVLRSSWLYHESSSDDDTNDTSITVPRSLELATPFQAHPS